MLNQTGGSLRSPNKAGNAPGGKQPLQALVEGDPELQKILAGEPAPVDHLIEQSLPEWANDKTPQKEPWSFDFAPREPALVEKADQPASEPPVQEPVIEKTPEPAKPVEPYRYKCIYRWLNDPETFSARAMLTGSVADVCLLNPDLRVRYRSLSGRELMAIEEEMPPLSNGVKSPEWMRNKRVFARLALAIVSMNDQPLGRTVQERIDALMHMPEEMLQVISDAGIEFNIRVRLRILGTQEQLKN